MTQLWTRPVEVRAWLDKKWQSGTLLTAFAEDRGWEPLGVPLRGPAAGEIAARLAEVQDWAAEWTRAGSGTSSPLRVEYKKIGGRQVGTNMIPCRAWIDSYDQAWEVLGVRAQVRRFRLLADATATSCPRLLPWLTRRPMQLLKLADRWDKLLATVRWIDERQSPGMYLRQVDVPGVDTKFIERHRGVLAELLDLQLVPGRFDADASDFAARYRFRRKPGYVRFRSPGFAGFTELSVRADEFAAPPPETRRAYVVENEITYLAFPLAGEAMVIFGGGYAVDVLESLAWLRDLDLVYWGDIDTHGFVILNRLRHRFRHAHSMLMDRATLLAHRDHWVTEPHPATASLDCLDASETELYRDLIDGALGPSVRLEQERISFAAIEQALSAHAIAAPLCPSHATMCHGEVRTRSSERRGVMTVAGTDDIDLSANEFWALPLAERAAAFARLRSEPRPRFFAEPEVPFSDQGPGYYALVRYADVVEASKHHEIFCSGKGATSIPDLPVEFNEYFGSMINIDDPRHARLRRIVSRAFSPRLIAKFEEDVRRVAASVVDDLLAAGPCDFVPTVAAKLPLKIICDMMGIPGDQYDMVLANTNIILSGADPEFLSEDMDQAVLQLLGAGQALADLVTGLAAERVQAPREDLVSALVTANIDGEQLTSAELASFFILLVVAGNETTRTALSHALMLLTEFPDQRALLLADMDNRLEGAVEEIVRYASPVVFMRRTLTRDYTMNGQDYRKDDKVVLYYYSANRDEDLFPDPERFDITRSPNPHVGFGAAGRHYCLGAHLARRELRVMLRELLTRVPDITAGEPDRLLSSFINGIKHLPCDFSR